LQFATGCKFRAGFRHIRRVENGRDDAPAFCARRKLHLDPAELISLTAVAGNQVKPHNAVWSKGKADI